MQSSKHRLDDDTLNNEPLKKMKLDFLVHDMPQAQHASTSSQAQKMKLDSLMHDMPSSQHAAPLPQPMSSVHFGQDHPVNQDEQNHIDATLRRMDAAVGLSMLSQAPSQQHLTPIDSAVDEDVGDAARILQQMVSNDAHASMQLDESVHAPPAAAPASEQPACNRVEGAFALLMLARGFADPNASGFDHFIDEDTYNADLARQQSVSEDDQATISAQSSQPELVPAIDPDIDSFTRGEGDEEPYQAPPGMDHDEVFHHHNDLWLNNLTPGTISRPEGKAHDQAIPQDPQEEAGPEVPTPTRPKRGKKTKVATTSRPSRKSKKSDTADVDDWQPPAPPDDDDDRDYKAPAHMKRGQNAKVTHLRWSSRLEEAKAREALADVQPQPSPSPEPAPAATPLPSPPPTSRRGKAKKANKTPKSDYNEGLMPSEANDFKFQYDSPSGTTAAQLDALLKVPARPKKFPLDLQDKDQMPLSYNQLHQKPKPGLADELVAKMEKAHAKEVKGWDDAESDEES